MGRAQWLWGFANLIQYKEAEKIRVAKTGEVSVLGKPSRILGLRGGPS